MHPFIQNLLKVENEALANNEYCLSMYHPIRNPSKTIIRTEVRNKIIQYFRESKLEGSDQLARSIAAKISDEVSFQEIYHKSLALFLKFPLNITGEKIVIDDNLYIFLSDYEVTENGCIEKVFDMTYLPEMIKTNRNALILNISWDKAEIYNLNEDKFEMIAEVINDQKEAMEQRFTGQHTTGQNIFVHQGSNIHEKEDKFAKVHLNKVVDKVKEITRGQKSYQNIIVFHSEQFSNFKDFLRNSLKVYSYKQPEVIQRNIDKGSNIREIAVETIEKLNKDDRIEEIKSIRTDLGKNFAQDWENVVEAARNAQIQKLYIKENSKEPGFVLDNDLPFIVAEDNTQSVENIVPWLIRKVMETDGEVIVIEREEDAIEFPVAAKLRYEMKEAL